VAVFDKASTFIPACDAMLDAGQLRYLPRFMQFAYTSRIVVLGVFAFALIYNSCAVVFALQGKLTPLLAAILMPLSSLTIVVLSTVTTWLLSKRILRKGNLK
jgi:Cu+-exporting ATPase